MTKITGEIKISSSVFNELKGKIKSLPDFREAVGKVLTENSSKILEVLLAGGILLEASDLHIEPEKEQAKLRVRIDGILQDVLFFPENVYQALLSRIKLVSGLKLNVSDRPQDGRFSVSVENLLVEHRISVLPAEEGESIVIRILNPKSLIDLEALGLRKDLLEDIKREIKKPTGMIIITGPTGSGKTTTLYAILKKIQRPEIKIITIEDPIEYHLKGISQTQVNPKTGYTFASGIKSIVRQDPDVILVGEIRDQDTAQTALQAALTGHLVFTTLHTNDAAGTVARLVSLGAKPSNIGPAINLAAAQRLIRKVCRKCSKLEKISPKDLKKLRRAFSKLPKKIKVPKLNQTIKIPKVKGCKFCNFTGYRGRTGIFEMFLVDEETKKFIFKNPSIGTLRNFAVKKGMIPLQQDGLIKVLEGKTTIEEIERATGPI
jgi:type II secretory ATPase GspE/PulE/Tfp pilus assembly ATPase PilB-like protein